MKKTLQIRQRLWILVIFLMVVMVLGGSASIIRGAFIQFMTEDVLEKDIPTLQAIYDIELNMMEQSYELMWLIQSPSEAGIRHIQDLRNDFEESLAIFEEMEEDWQKDLILDSVMEYWQLVTDGQDRIFTYIRGANYTPSSEFSELYHEVGIVAGYQTEIYNLFEEKVRTATQEELDYAGYAVSQAGSSSLIIIIFSSVTSVLIGLVISIRTSLRITRPLRRLQFYMQSIEEGGRSLTLEGLFNDEFGSIGNSLTAMVESMTDAENRLARMNTEQGRILGSVKFGILMLDNSYTIGSVYSGYAGALFSPVELSGKNFIDLIYSGESSAFERNLLERFLNQVKGNTIVSKDMLDDINPLKDYEYRLKDGSGRVLRLVFSFYSLGENQDGVMVIIEDKTELLESQAETELERRSHESDLEVLYQALKIGPDILKNELIATLESCRMIERSLLGQISNEQVNSVYRTVHSIKGVAASFGLEQLAHIAHELENKLNIMRDSDDDGPKIVTQELTAVLVSLSEGVERALGLLDQLLSQSGKPVANAHMDTLNLRLNNMVETVADQLDKEVLFESQLHQKMKQYDGVDSAVIHLLRNALDHGLEEKFERIAVGKQNPASLKIECSEDDRHLNIVVSDDGKGLDFKKIAQKAREKGLISEDREFSAKELVGLIFKPGFSGKDSVDQISGRGVGLDAVKAAVQQHNGRISVTSQPGKGTTFKIKLPLN